MEPRASFKIPILLRRKGVDDCLNSRVHTRLSSSLAFQPTNGQEDIRNWHELSPRLSMILNPGYRGERLICQSEMKVNYVASSNHSPDRSFFKRKDEIGNYTDHFFRNRILYSKK